MPFGLTNTLITYQTLINNILKEYLNDFIVTYLDDILIYNKNEKEHTGYVIKFLKALKRTRLKINEEKLIFYQTKVKFLRYILTTTDIKINSEKVKTVLDWPISTTVKKSAKIHRIRELLSKVHKGILGYLGTNH
jgi:Reverse transcriptase (RNA-dependent DNA polymerase)